MASDSKNVVSLQWSLNETSDSVIGVAKGILKAATSDNVQPLAILAVQAFGATLAICQDTQVRVEKEARKSYVSHVIQFLKSQIGYVRGDSADALMQSNAGVRFLSLAAALTTYAPFEAARCLELMLTSSASLHQLLPTVLQLRDLVGALEYKMNRAGFADLVLKWHLRLVAEYPQIGQAYWQDLDLTKASKHPSPPALNALIKAFRSVHRVGEGTNVHITACYCGPWIIAFTEWCLGSPPRVLLQSGKVLFHDNISGSKVDIWLLPIGGSVEVKLFFGLDRPAQLWTTPKDSAGQWTGMVSIRNFATKQIQACQLGSSLGYRALFQALVHSISAVIMFMNNRTPGGYQYERDLSLQRTSGTQKVPSLNGRLCGNGIFAADYQIISVLAEFLNVEDHERCQMKDLSEDMSVEDLKIVALYMKDLQKECPCAHCSDDPMSFMECKKTLFKYYISTMTAQILAISLFEFAEPILLHFQHSRVAWGNLSPHDDFIHYVDQILFPEMERTATTNTAKLQSRTRDIDRMKTSRMAFKVLDLALWLIGHDTTMEKVNNGYWIASVGKGQIVYPSIYDVEVLDPKGVLRLGGGPGALLYNGVKYEKVISLDRVTYLKPESVDYPTSVTAPKNFLPGAKLEWQVRKPLQPTLAS